MNATLALQPIEEGSDNSKMNMAISWTNTIRR